MKQLNKVRQFSIQLPREPQDVFDLVLKLLACSIPLALAIILAPLMGARVSPDGSTYLAQALNLYNGNGYLNADGSTVALRGPGFPLLLSTYFYLFGPSAASGLALIRTFYVLNIALMYCIGYRIAGHLVGFATSVLLLTSFGIHEWGARIHLDIIMPSMILASIFVLLVAFERRSRALFGLAGLILGISVITKEISLLFAPLPILLCLTITSYRCRHHLSGLFLFYLLFFVPVIPWLISVISNPDVFASVVRTGSWILTSGFGPGAQVAVDPVNAMDGLRVVESPSFISKLFGSVFQTFGIISSRLTEFYQNFFADTFVLAPLMLGTWLLTVLSSLVKRDRWSIVNCLMLLCFLPIVLFLGEVSYRAGQAYFLYLLSYLVLAYQLLRLMKGMKLHSLYYLGTVSLFVAMQIWMGNTNFTQLLRQQDNSGYVANARSYGFSLWSKDWSTSEWHETFIVDAGMWLNENINSNDVILSDWEWLETYFFYTEGRNTIHEIEYVSSQNFESFSGDAEPVKIIWTQAGRTNPAEPLSNLFAFSESLFLNQVRDIKATHVVIGKRRNFLASYLNQHPSFEPIAEFGSGQIRIYKIREAGVVEPLKEQPVYVSNQLFVYLANLRAQSSGASYTGFISGFFQDTLQLSPAQINEIEARNASSFAHGTIFSIANYVQLVEASGSEYLNRSILSLEEKAALHPLNPQTHLLLAEAYSVANQPQKAEELYAYALSISENQPGIYSVLIDVYHELSSRQELDPELSNLFEKKLAKQVEQNPEIVENHLNLARTYEILLMPFEALRVYNEALVQWPTNPLLYRHIGDIYHALGRQSAAIKAYSKALEIDPTNDEIALKISALYLETDMTVEHMEFLREAVRKNPFSSQLHLELGELFLVDSQ